MNDVTSEFGLIGLAVMGQNLALNVADHGYQISVYNRTYSKTLEFLARNEYSNNLFGYETLKSFVQSIQKPRKIIIMVHGIFHHLKSTSYVFFNVNVHHHRCHESCY